MNEKNKNQDSTIEKEIIESYNGFIGLINLSDINKKIVYNRFVFIISIVLFAIGVFGGIEDIGLIIGLYDAYILKFISLPSLILSFILFIMALKRKKTIENTCKSNYKSILEESLNIELDDYVSDDDSLEKLSKSEYIKAGFKYADDNYLYMSTERILINKTVEAYLVQIDKSTNSDYSVYIVNGYITKQKIKNDKNCIVKGTDKIVSEFNKQCGYSIKNNIEVSLYNGYLYILINENNLYFEYSKLIEYDTYKKLYYNLKLMEKLSRFIYDNINDFLK